MQQAVGIVGGKSELRHDNWILALQLGFCYPQITRCVKPIVSNLYYIPEQSYGTTVTKTNSSTLFAMAKNREMPVNLSNKIREICSLRKYY